MTTIHLLAPHVRTQPDAAEFADYLEESVGGTPDGLAAFFEGGSGYCWEADVPPRAEWKQAAADLEFHIAENLVNR